MRRLERCAAATFVRQCQECDLWKAGNGPVAGIGPEDARLVIVGRNPGREEDEAGEPFVGRSGRGPLAAILAACGLKREEVGIVNRVSCYTPDNRPPTPEELAACDSIAERQFLFFQNVRVVLTLGREARDWVLPMLVGRTMTETESRPLLADRYLPSLSSIPVWPLRHPSFFLRDQKAAKWFGRFRLPKVAQFVKNLAGK